MATAPGGKPLIDLDREWESDLDEIFGRYLLYWEALDIAWGAPQADPDYPPLYELSTTEAHDDLRQQIRAYEEASVIAVIPEGSIDDHVLVLPNPAPLTSVEGAEVIIQDCWVTDRELRTLEGDLFDQSFAPVLRNVTMKYVDGEWRVFASVDASEESGGYQECQEFFDQLS